MYKNNAYMLNILVMLQFLYYKTAPLTTLNVTWDVCVFCIVIITSYIIIIVTWPHTAIAEMKKEIELKVMKF